MLLASLVMAVWPKGEPVRTGCCLGSVAVTPDETGTRFQRPSLIGTWKYVRFVTNGETGEDVDRFQLRIDKSFIRVQLWGKQEVERCWYEIDDESLLHARIDFGSNSAALFHGKGIYAIDGDTLKICIGKERPDSFDSSRGSGRTLRVFKRVAS